MDESRGKITITEKSCRQ